MAPARPFPSATPFDGTQGKLKTGETISFGTFLGKSGARIRITTGPEPAEGRSEPRERLEVRGARVFMGKLVIKMPSVNLVSYAFPPGRLGSAQSTVPMVFNRPLALSTTSN